MATKTKPRPPSERKAAQPKSIPVTFRLKTELHEAFALRAAKAKMSPGGLAAEIVLKHIEGEEAELESLPRILKQLEAIRREHALSTEALLTVLGTEADSHKTAAAWVRNNLNRD